MMPVYSEDMSWLRGLGFGGLGFRIWGLGFGVWGLGFWGFGVLGLGFRIWGLGFGVWGFRAAQATHHGKERVFVVGTSSGNPKP